MRVTDLYSSTAPKETPEPQATSNPVATTRDTSPKPMIGQHAVTLSWLGIVLALIALRVVYEFSE